MSTLLAKKPEAEAFDATSGCISEFREFDLCREDEVGMIFISCESIPHLFIAVDSENNVRPAIDQGLRNAFEGQGVSAQVFTNGSISAPTIHTVVKLTK